MLRGVIVVLAVVSACGCDNVIGQSFGSGGADGSAGTGGGGGGSGGSGGSGGNDPLSAERQQCLDKINAYRDTLSLPHYKLWNGISSCADSQAKSDKQSGTAHGAFGQCNEFAQNECPDWSINKISSASGSCLDMMWAEGPGADFKTHGHYINMSSTQYTMVACGFSASSGSIWAVQDFK